MLIGHFVEIMDLNENKTIQTPLIAALILHFSSHFPIKIEIAIEIMNIRRCPLRGSL